jgi:predicted nucleotide-binding protein
MSQSSPVPDTKNEAASEKAKMGRPAAGSPSFPRYSLKKTIELAQSIETNNAGKPYDRLDLAKSLDWSPNSSGFRLLITAAGKYGVTVGSYQADKIGLSGLGSSIVAPTSDDGRREAMRQALMTPDLFKRVYAFFDKKQVPREELFKNTLKKEFQVDTKDVDACYKILMENVQDYGLLNEIKGNQFLQLDKLAHAGTGQSLLVDDSRVEESTVETSAEEPVAPEPVTAQKPINKQIFIAHGKNKKPLEQLIHILQKYKIPHIVATDEPHKGRPVGVKVAQEMKKCTSGIFIFTADEETKDPDGNLVMRPRDNVVYELGAGSVLYEDKIIILREVGVELPSDFSEVGHVTFEKDNLNAKGLELMTELAGLDIIKFTVT